MWPYQAISGSSARPLRIWITECPHGVLKRWACSLTSVLGGGHYCVKQSATPGGPGAVGYCKG